MDEVFEMKCRYCSKVFYDYGEYRLRKRLKDHMKDEHNRELEEAE